MAITGNLRTMQLSELLQWLSMGQKTGTLAVHGKPGDKRIFFQNGRIISSASTLEREYLGHFLVAFGYITEEELTRAMQVQEESKILLGKILVMIGAIKESELADLIRLKAAETIYDIFLWTEGAFEFIDGEIPKLPMIPISVDVTGIVMEGLRRYDEWQRIRTRIQSLKQVPVVLSPVDPKALEERDRLILVAIDGERSLEEIAVATHNPDFHIAKFAFELLESGHARLEAAKGAPTPVPGSRPLEDPDEPVFADATLPPVGSRALDDEFSIEPPEPPPKPKTQDFAQFLKRGPDSSVTAAIRAASRVATLDPEASPRPTPPPAPAPVPTPAPELPAPGDVSASRPRIPSGAIPKLTKPMEELMSWSFTPNEAFIVSRINGLWDVKSIVKISPFPEGEVIRVFQKLHDGGVISWR